MQKTTGLYKHASSRMFVLNQLTPRDAYLRKRCVYCYQRILPDPLKDYTNLKLFVLLLLFILLKSTSCYLKFLFASFGLIFNSSTLVKQKILRR